MLKNDSLKDLTSLDRFPLVEKLTDNIAANISGGVWKKYPGKARDVGDGWVIGTGSLGDGNYKIYKWNNKRWEKMPGGGVSIGGDYDNPWVVNASGSIYRWEQ